MSKSKVPDSLERVGAAIRLARTLRRLTQEELAAAVGLSRPTVVAAEAGRSVSSYNLFALCGYLGVHWTVGGMAQPAYGRRRPTIAELMSSERSRRRRLSAPDERAVAPNASRESMTMPVKPIVETPRGIIAPRRARPRIAGLIAAERRRRKPLPPSGA